VTLASLSIAGVPPLLGFAAKKGLLAALSAPWAAGVVLVSLGTVMVYARLWGAPVSQNSSAEPLLNPPLRRSVTGLVLVLLLAGIWQLQSTLSWGALLSTALLLAAGVALQRLLQRFRAAALQLPALGEQLQDLLGNLALVGSGLLLAFRLGFS
jgi:multicomponent Na+:H+ antiporter subunit D